MGDPAQAKDSPVEINHADGVSQVTLNLSEDNVWVKKGNYRFAKGKGRILFTAKGAGGFVAAHKIGLIRTDGSPGP